MKGWRESVVGTPGAWAKKAESPDASSSPGHPQPLPQDEESFPWKGKFPPSAPSSPSCPCRKPACTDHFYSRLSCSLHNIWAELHVHGVRGHSKIVSGHHGRHLGLWGGKWLVPGGGKEVCVTDQLLIPPPLPASKYRPHPSSSPPHSPFHSHLDSSWDVTPAILTYLFICCGEERRAMECSRFRGEKR